MTDTAMTVKPQTLQPHHHGCQALSVLQNLDDQRIAESTHTQVRQCVTEKHPFPKSKTVHLRPTETHSPETSKVLFT